MSQTPTSANAPDCEAELPSQGIRTAITFLLLLHFFALFVAVCTNFGAYRSPLRMQLRRVPGVEPYLRLLHMNTGYGYPFVIGTPEDYDHICDVVLNTPVGFQGTAEEIAALETIALMPPATWPGMRRRRYLMLALQTALFVDDDQNESLLPAALAGGMLDAAGITEGVHRFRCRSQESLTTSDVAAPEPSRREPDHPSKFFNVYQADLVRSNDRWLPSKVEDRGQMTQRRRGSEESRP